MSTWYCPSVDRARLRNVRPSSSRSWSSRGSQRASSCATESSAHSVVPLNPSTVPVGYSCGSTTMSEIVNTWSASVRTANRSPGAGRQRRPAVWSCSARETLIICSVSGDASVSAC